MKAEIITIGDEILIGQIIDTNSAWIAQLLNEEGFEVVRISSVGDRRGDILSALDCAKKRAGLVIMTGGLGPTRDDITKGTLCEYFNTRLVFNPQVLENIKRIFKNGAYSLNKLNRKQAEVAENARLLENTQGTAAGMWFEKDGAVYISLPGVPDEMKIMMEKQVMPALKKHFPSFSIYHKTILTQGLMESKMALQLSDFEDQLPSDIRLAYLPSPGMLRLRLSATGDSKKNIQKKIEKQVIKLQAIIPEYIFGYDRQSLQEIIGQWLTDRKETLSVAESCTGGYLSHLITSAPGSSAYFKGSVIAYANEIKENVLGVSAKNIAQYGAVSREVVEQMASGVCKKYNTTWSIAVSGIAGPSGGTDDKPVGTTWIAVASKNKVMSKHYIFGQYRDRNIIRASFTALNMLRKEMST